MLNKAMVTHAVELADEQPQKHRWNNIWNGVRMIRLADFVARHLADCGVRHLFMVTGGGAMHLNDAFGREERIRYICNHHEQACAIAAEGYARVSGKIGVINVTTGPGGINALNGVFGAWTDSIPMLIISGQVKRETCLATYQIPGLRQLGDQETDIISMVKGITKYAVLVDDPRTIRYHLDKALYLATSARPGPCWIDIPIDIQGSQVEEIELWSYPPEEDQPDWNLEQLAPVCRAVLSRIQTSQRPVIMAGYGVRAAGAVKRFEAVVEKLGIPVTTAWTGHDLLSSDHPLCCGRPGTVGDRPGNFTVQNADTLLILGSRLNIRQVGYNWRSFARHAFKIQVDADAAELAKPTVPLDMPIRCDLGLFLEELERQLSCSDHRSQPFQGWVDWCKARVSRYPVVLPKHLLPGETINPYHFVDVLFRHLTSEDVIVCGNGSACVIPFQAGRLKKGQRMFANSGCASMGYDLPAAIGAAVAANGRRIICLAGDGSLQMNMQELQTMFHHQLPVKLFVLNNGGYVSIRQTQANFFGNFVGSGPDSGVSFPEMLQLAQAYRLPAVRMGPSNFPHAMLEVLNAEGPMVCEVMLDPHQEFEPKSASRQLADGRIVSSPLEDLYPFLSRDELLGNLLVPPLED
jgi:acetolactate synthase I/II/III large subunit